jgi:acetylglutamate kinase
VSRVVVKLGGRVASDSLGLVLDLHAAGDEVVIVHGAGPQISAALAARGSAARFVAGRRVTDTAAMNVVRAVLVTVGEELCAALGDVAVQCVGDEIGLEAVPVPELGLVGEPLPCCPPKVLAALGEGRVPVVTPLAVGPLNVNADEAATALASGLDAERLLFVSDVPGVYVEGAVVPRLEADRAAALLDAGAFDGGIVPKLLAAVRASRHGIVVEIGDTAVVA